MFRTRLAAGRPRVLSLHNEQGRFSWLRFRQISHGDVDSARAWLLSFTLDSIPQHLCKVTYSRSSGPGGQNVNKVNTKATLRIPVPALLQHVPQMIHDEIRESSYYARSSDSLVIQSDESRSQAQNAKSCYHLLFGLIKSAAQKRIPGETSEGQKQKVAKLKVEENEKRLVMKKRQSQKKISRSFHRRYDG